MVRGGAFGENWSPSLPVLVLCVKFLCPEPLHAGAAFDTRCDSSVRLPKECYGIIRGRLFGIKSKLGDYCGSTHFPLHAYAESFINLHCACQPWWHCHQISLRKTRPTPVGVVCSLPEEPANSLIERKVLRTLEKPQ